MLSLQSYHSKMSFTFKKPIDFRLRNTTLHVYIDYTIIVTVIIITAVTGALLLTFVHLIITAVLGETQTSFSFYK